MIRRISILTLVSFKQNHSDQMQHVNPYKGGLVYKGSGAHPSQRAGPQRATILGYPCYAHKL